MSTGEYLDLGHMAMQMVHKTTLVPYVLLEGPPFRQGLMKNNFEHAHVVSNIRFERAQKTILLFINTFEETEGLKLCD